MKAIKSSRSRPNLRYASAMSKQRGVVLIVGLIMVLLLTIIGLASIRGSDLQERMAGNVRDRNIAFQSAEAGLRAGEVILTGAVLPEFNGANGLWPDLQKPGAPRTPPRLWSDADWNANSVAAGYGLENVSAQPRYVVERVITPINPSNEGSGIDLVSLQKLEEGEFFRITSRAQGGNPNTVVVLQSTYKR